MWLLRLHAALGSLVATLGLWLAWGGLPLWLLVAVALGSAGFLARRGRGPRHAGQHVAGQMWGGAAGVWAWVTLLLGLESLAWPLVTMVQVRMAGPEPTEQQMGLVLTAVLFGVFSSVFWLTFSYGLFQWIKRKEGG